MKQILFILISIVAGSMMCCSEQVKDPIVGDWKAENGQKYWFSEMQDSVGTYSITKDDKVPEFGSYKIFDGRKRIAFDRIRTYDIYILREYYSELKLTSLADSSVITLTK